MEVDLDALRAVLPWWLNLGAWLLAPVIMSTCALAVMWLCLRAERVDPDGLHWTEVARRQHAGNVVVRFVFLSLTVVVALSVGLLANGLLTPVGTTTRAAPAGVLFIVPALVLCHRRTRRVLPGLTLRGYLQNLRFVLVVMLPPVVVALAMALLGPDRFDGAELRFLIVYGGGMALVVSLYVGGLVPFARAFGALRPADERLRRIVAEAGRRCGHEVRGAWIVRAPVANAAALPRSNQILFTEGAMAAMDDDELLAVALHELGHLREAPHVARLRMLTILPLLPIAFVRPLIALVDFYGWLLLVFVSLACASLLGRRMRGFEADADAHAHEHADGEQPGVYARALELVHRLNLAPVVMPGKGASHPHLYDRMLAAGVQPDYERPAPPKPNRARALMLLPLVVGLVVANGVIRASLYDGVYDREATAMWCAAWVGGDVTSIGALGYHWRERRPEDAAVLLAFASERSQASEYPAFLAGLLAERDPDSARAYLQLAVQRHLDEGIGEGWQQDWIEQARDAIEAAERGR